MAVYTTIDKSTDYFNTVLYTGTGSDNNAITGVGFSPDWVWLKKRSATGGHFIQDRVRGATKSIYTDGNFAEDTVTTAHKSFDSDGFTLGTNGNVNISSGTHVSWNWLAGGSASSNSNGTITSSVSVNTTAGFSIATYTGNNSNAQTIGHGLGVAPKVYIIKRRDSSSAWGMYHGSLGTNKYLQVESTNAVATDTGIWNNTAPTSTVLSLGNAGYFNNASSGTYVCYAFSEVKGYSSMGTYIGNGSADGTFVYTGFKPAWVMRKISSTSGGWLIHDSTKTPFNGLNSNTNGLRPNSTEAEFDFFDIDYLSNGFKLRTAEANHNTNDATFIYMAFAESPFVNSNGVPNNAR